MAKKTAIRSLTMLNESGDTSIVWDEDQDDEMERIIQRKMDAGVTFYIIEPRAWGLLPPKKTPLIDVKDAFEKRALSIKDADLAAFVGEGKGDVVSAPNAPIKTVRRGKTAKEVAGAESVGIKQRKGG